MNKIQIELESRRLKQQILEQEKRLSSLQSKLDNLRRDSGQYATSSGIFFGPASLLTENSYIKSLKVEEIWFNDRIYLDACGFHNIEEKEDSTSASCTPKSDSPKYYAKAWRACRTMCRNILRNTKIFRANTPG